MKKAPNMVRYRSMPGSFLCCRGFQSGCPGGSSSLLHILPGGLLISEVTAIVVPLEIIVGVTLPGDVGGDLRGAVPQHYLGISHPAAVDDLIALAHSFSAHPVHLTGVSAFFTFFPAAALAFWRSMTV